MKKTTYVIIGMIVLAFILFTVMVESSVTSANPDTTGTFVIESAIETTTPDTIPQ